MPASRRIGWWAAVAIGGACGALARYETLLTFPVEREQFPWSLFVVNVVGCLVVGVVMGVVVRRPHAPSWLRPLLVIGVCGGLTTFSTWMVTDVLLVRDRAVGLAVIDVVASIATGLLAVWAGFRAAAAASGGGSVDELDVREAD